MKHLFWLLAILPFFFSCNPEDNDSPPPEIIELDGATWNYTEKFGLIRFAGSINGNHPAFRDIYVKIDGQDGSFLYLILPQELFDSLPSMPYEIEGKAAYYANSGVLTESPLEGLAIITLLGIDPNTQEMRLSFDAVVNKVDDTSVHKHFKSGEISAIDFKEVNGYASMVQYEIMNDQNMWHISEYGSDMQNGQIDWMFYNSDSFPMSTTVRLAIPWGQVLGISQVEPGSPRAMTLDTGGINWILESGEITLEENNFRAASQKGHFRGVFHHPDFPDQKFQISEGKFEVSFQP